MSWRRRSTRFWIRFLRSSCAGLSLGGLSLGAIGGLLLKAEARDANSAAKADVRQLSLAAEIVGQALADMEQIGGLFDRQQESAVIGHRPPPWP